MIESDDKYILLRPAIKLVAISYFNDKPVNTNTPGVQSVRTNSHTGRDQLCASSSMRCAIFKPIVLGTCLCTNQNIRTFLAHAEYANNITNLYKDSISNSKISTCPITENPLNIHV